MERKQSLILWYLRGPFEGSGFVVLLFTPLEKYDPINSQEIEGEKVIHEREREGEREREDWKQKKRCELDPEKRIYDRTSILFLSLTFSLFLSLILFLSSSFSSSKRKNVEQFKTHWLMRSFWSRKMQRFHSPSSRILLDVLLVQVQAWISVTQILSHPSLPKSFSLTLSLSRSSTLPWIVWFLFRWVFIPVCETFPPLDKRMFGFVLLTSKSFFSTLFSLRPEKNFFASLSRLFYSKLEFLTLSTLAFTVCEIWSHISSFLIQDKFYLSLSHSLSLSLSLTLHYFSKAESPFHSFKKFFTSSFWYFDFQFEEVLSIQHKA